MAYLTITTFYYSDVSTLHMRFAKWKARKASLARSPDATREHGPSTACRRRWVQIGVGIGVALPANEPKEAGLQLYSSKESNISLSVGPSDRLECRKPVYASTRRQMQEPYLREEI